MKRSEASTTMPVTLQLTGFSSIEQAKQFLAAILRPDLVDHFAKAPMTFDGGVFTNSSILCCNADHTEYGSCTDLLISELCIPVGSGCIQHEKANTDQ